MILVIDHYDSFVYNLVQLVESLGYETLVVSLLLLGDLLPWYGETKRAELAFERVIALCEDHGDRGLAVGQLVGQGDERERRHPVAQAGDGLADQQAPEAGRPQEPGRV